MYRVVRLLSTLRSVEKMYMPPVIDTGQSVIRNRILRPGGTFVMNDVAALDAYDPDDPHQRRAGPAHS